jgi:hypothetical protein
LSCKWPVFLRGFPDPKPCTHLALLPHVLSTPPISSFIIWSPGWHLATSGNYDCLITN